jgi:type 1 glutamine amidotransferase
MQRREMLKATGLALGLTAFPHALAQGAATPRRKVLMFTRSAGFQHSSIQRKDPSVISHAEQVLTEIGKKHGFDVTATKDGGVFDGDLTPYDAFFFYTTGDLTSEQSVDKTPPMSAAGKQKLLDAIAGGKGFCGSHCASDTFHSPGHNKSPRDRQMEPDPYIVMLGGEFISHGRQQAGRQVVAARDFPGVSGLGEAFVLPEEEWYSLKNFTPDLHVVLAMDTQGMDGKDYERPSFPSTWARQHGKGRVFYTSMGHREDVWTNPVFQEIVLGGLGWACGNVDADVTPNLEKVCPGANVMPPK